MEKICKNCQYCRPVVKDKNATLAALVHGYYCSNSKAPLFRYVSKAETFVTPKMTCPEFTQAGKKAPARLRFANYILSLEQQNPRKFWLIVGEIALFLFWVIMMTILTVIIYG